MIKQGHAREQLRQKMRPAIVWPHTITGHEHHRHLITYRCQQLTHRPIQFDIDIPQSRPQVATTIFWARDVIGSMIVPEIVASRVRFPEHDQKQIPVFP